jgi:protoporphyrinogen IX oxidase
MIDNLYLWIKALHIIAVISWMAGLLYLPRLFVYHAGVSVGSDADKMLQTMERRLLKFIMNPAMIVSFILGIWLIKITGSGMPDSGGWMHVKLFLVLVMAAAHGMMAKHRKQFAAGTNKKSAKYYRIFNEIPTLLMVVIVLLVVLKPF